MKQFCSAIIFTAFVSVNFLCAQNIAINTTGAAPNTSAGLDIDFSNKGLLIPRVSLTSATDALTIPSPATSLLVYHLGSAGLPAIGYYYNSGTSIAPVWVQLLNGGAPGTAWLTLGNAGTTAGTNFIGTTDAKDLVFKTNNTERMRIVSGGNVGIGTTTPLGKLHLTNGINGEMYIEGTNKARLLAFSGGGFWIQSGTAYTSGSVDDIVFSGMFGSPEWMRIKGATGNVGIGTTAPAVKLDVAGSIRATTEIVSASGASEGGQITLSEPFNASAAGEGCATWSIDVFSNSNFRIFHGAASCGNGQDMLHITTGGKVGIGTTAPDAALHIKAVVPTAGNRPAGGIYLGTPNNPNVVGQIGLVQNTSEGDHYLLLQSVEDGVAWRNVILARDGGNVGIGTTAPDMLLSVNGSADNTTGVWGTFSDRRLKTNIHSMEGALETVTKLQGVTFHWKDAKKDSAYGEVMGFIAQEVEKVIPSWVKTSSATGYLMLEPVGINALLVESIKEQQKIIDNLKAEVSGFRFQVSGLQTENKTLKAEVGNMNSKFTGLEAIVKTLQLQINSPATSEVKK